MSVCFMRWSYWLKLCSNTHWMPDNSRFYMYTVHVCPMANCIGMLSVNEFSRFRFYSRFDWEILCWMLCARPCLYLNHFPSTKYLLCSKWKWFSRWVQVSHVHKASALVFGLGLGLIWTNNHKETERKTETDQKINWEWATHTCNDTRKSTDLSW